MFFFSVCLDTGSWPCWTLHCVCFFFFLKQQEEHFQEYKDSFHYDVFVLFPSAFYFHSLSEIPKFQLEFCSMAVWLLTSATWQTRTSSFTPLKFFDPRVFQEP